MTFTTFLLKIGVFGEDNVLRWVLLATLLGESGTASLGDRSVVGDSTEGLGDRSIVGDMAPEGSFDGDGHIAFDFSSISRAAKDDEFFLSFP